jgi:hypothetical protein
MVLGSGNDKIIEMAEVHASPTMLWANTNDTNEANARRLIENLRPDLPLAFIVSWLAGKYPRGLTGGGTHEYFRAGFSRTANGRTDLKKQTLSFPKQILMSLVLASIFIGFEPKPVQRSGRFSTRRNTPCNLRKKSKKPPDGWKLSIITLRCMKKPRSSIRKWSKRH